MKDDDERGYGDRGYRRSRPFGPGWPLPEGSLFERVMRDVASWFDEDEDGHGFRGRGGPRDVGAGRTPGRRPRRGARPRDGSGNDSTLGRRARPTGEYDDEDGSSSLRGRGPKRYRRSDERLTELVNDALYDDEEVDASDVEVSVKDGEVRLSGSVPRRRHKHRAENVAARVAFTPDVDNRLRVRRGGASASADARASTSGAGGTPGEAARDADDYGHP